MATLDATAATATGPLRPVPADLAPAATPSSRRYTLLVAALVVSLAVFHVVWLREFRVGYPLDVDESGYLAIAADQADAFRTGRWSAVLDAYRDQAPQAPLVPLLTTPLLLRTRTVWPAFAVPLAFLAVLVTATYALARRLTTAPLAAVAAVVTACLPVVLVYSRSYHFSVPSTALSTAAVWALLRSRGLSRRGWGVAAGALMGLAVLARTMSLSLVPGFAAAAGLLALLARDRRRARAVNLSLTLAAGVAVAATWYHRSLPTVLDYLLGTGYKGGSRQFPPASLDALETRSVGEKVATQVQQAAAQVHLPMVALLATALAVGGWMALRRRRFDVDAVRRWMEEGNGVLVVVAVPAGVAITAATPGSGFWMPLSPLVVTMALRSVAAAPAVWRRALVVLLVSVSAFEVLASSGAADALARVRKLNVPGAGGLEVTDGRPLVGFYFQPDVPPGSEYGELPAGTRRWQPFHAEAARWLVGYAGAHGRTPIVSFATRDRTFNTNSLLLAARFHLRAPMSVTQLLPTRRGGDSVRSYRTQLSHPALGQPNFVVTGPPRPGEFLPRISQARVVAAARGAGFVRVRTLVAPDGRRFGIWWHADRGPLLAGG